MLAAAAVLPQSTEAMEMVVLGAAVVEMHRALPIRVVAVAGRVLAPCPQVGWPG